MTEVKPAIFRAEALAHRSGPAAVGGPLEGAARWTEPLFWVLLVVCACALGLCMTATIPEYASGPARLDSGKGILLALLPSRHHSALKPGLALTFTAPGRPAIGGMTVDSVASETLDPLAARRMLGPEVVLADDVGLVVMARARALPGAELGTGHANALPGQAEIRIGSEPLLFAFVPGLRTLLGRTIREPRLRP